LLIVAARDLFVCGGWIDRIARLRHRRAEPIEETTLAIDRVQGAALFPEHHPFAGGETRHLATKVLILLACAERGPF
jgi:hypothetical protein